jgi:hypothetical protein
MFKEENHQNKKLEQVQKYKKTGRIVTQLLYENHLFGSLDDKVSYLINSRFYLPHLIN